MTYWRLFYHLVWATRERAPLIDATCAEVIEPTISSVCRDEGSLVHAIGIMPDHVHLAVSIPPRMAVASLARRLKSASSYEINRDARLTRDVPFAWQSEYGVVSFGEESLQRVIAYVTHQQDHHTTNKLWPVFEHIDRPTDGSSPRDPDH